MYNPDNLPLWKSHKIVAAAKIAKITLPEGHYRLAPLALELADGTTRDLLVTIEFIQRFKPEVGGYFVRYDSGNAIFFNGDEFETTYTLVPAVPLTDCDVSLSEFMKRPKVWEVVGDEPGYAAPVVLMLMAEMREAAARLAEGDTALLRRQGHKDAADAYSLAARRVRAIDAEALMSEVLGMPRTTLAEFEAFKEAAKAAQFNVQVRDDGALYHPSAQHALAVWRAGVRFAVEVSSAPAVPEGVDTAELRTLLYTLSCTTGAKNKEIEDRVVGLLAQQREAGRREERAKVGRVVHDFPALQAFHVKHALGPMLPPSCLCCGQQTHPLTRPVAIKHGELPGIVICTACRDAALATRQPVSEGITPEKILSFCEAKGWGMRDDSPFHESVKAVIDEIRALRPAGQPVSALTDEQMGELTRWCYNPMRGLFRHPDGDLFKIEDVAALLAASHKVEPGEGESK